MTTNDECEYSFGKHKCPRRAQFEGVSLSTGEMKRVCDGHRHFLNDPKEIR